jgi:hypothetical protein
MRAVNPLSFDDDEDEGIRAMHAGEDLDAVARRLGLGGLLCYAPNPTSSLRLISADPQLATSLTLPALLQQRSARRARRRRSGRWRRPARRA